MRKITLLMSLAFCFAIVFNACNSAAPTEEYQAEWLGNTKQEMIDNIEEQFQGFSRTMVETGYRYMELYWAGKDQNWEYAEYQREHMEEALEEGFVRRPDRELSSRQFMNVVLPEMEKAIASKDLSEFLKAFEVMTNQCNTCHQMEQVGFMTVVTPKIRNTVIHY